MRGLWLIDGTSKWLSPLVGNFATRAFASFSNFQGLVKFEAPQVANLAVVVTESLDVHVDDVERWFQDYLPSVPRLYIGSVFHQGAESVSQNILKPKLIDLVSSKINQGSETCMIYKDLWFEKSHYRFRVTGHSSVTLSPKEARLIQLFMQFPTRCVSREDLREKVWEGRAVSPRTIDSHISRMRRHLTGSEVVIDSVYGDGYVMR